MAIDHRGLRLAESKLAAIAHATPPGIVAEMRVFLGVIWYLSKFVEGYGTIAAPCMDVLKNCTSQSTTACKMRIS